MRPAAIALCVFLTACIQTVAESEETTTLGGGSSTSSTTRESQPVTTTSDLPTNSTSDVLAPESLTVEAFPVPAGSRPHDVAPALDGGVWYTAQGLGELGWLDHITGETRHIALGAGSRPHGVIVDVRGTPWITDGGVNAIVSVDPGSNAVTVFPLPDDTIGANLNTASFGADGTL